MDRQCRHLLGHPDFIGMASQTRLAALVPFMISAFHQGQEFYSWVGDPRSALSAGSAIDATQPLGC